MASEPTQPSPPPPSEYDDNRSLWDWQSKYPDASVARRYINGEAFLLAFYFCLFGLLSVIAACCTTNLIVTLHLFGLDVAIPRTGAVLYTAGCLGGTLFSIKWLLHSVGTGRWHRDRFYWRAFVPVTAGVYAIIIAGLIHLGLMRGAVEADATGIVIPLLVGYFGDGVNGLLTNIANAIFGTVEKK